MRLAALVRVRASDGVDVRLDVLVFVGFRVGVSIKVEEDVAFALDVRVGDGGGVSEDLDEIVDVRVGDGVGVGENRADFTVFRVGVGVSAGVTVAVGVRVGDVLCPGVGLPLGIGTPSKTTLGSIEDCLSADEGLGFIDGVSPSCRMTNKRSRMTRNQ